MMKLFPTINCKNKNLTFEAFRSTLEHISDDRSTIFYLTPVSAIQWTLDIYNKGARDWFARDVTKVMLVVCWWSEQKHFSLLGTKPYSYEFFKKKVCCIDH